MLKKRKSSTSSSRSNPKSNMHPAIKLLYEVTYNNEKNLMYKNKTRHTSESKEVHWLRTKERRLQSPFEKDKLVGGYLKNIDIKGLKQYLEYITKEMNKEVYKHNFSYYLNTRSFDKDGLAPMHYAAREVRNPSLLKTLVEIGGAKLEVTTKHVDESKNRNNILHIATEFYTNGRFEEDFWPLMDYLKKVLGENRIRILANQKNGENKFPYDKIELKTLEKDPRQTEFLELFKPDETIDADADADVEVDVDVKDDKVDGNYQQMRNQQDLEAQKAQKLQAKIKREIREKILQEEKKRHELEEKARLEAAEKEEIERKEREEKERLEKEEVQKKSKGNSGLTARVKEFRRLRATGQVARKPTYVFFPNFKDD